MTLEDRIEAVADAWASIDGHLDDFRAGKTAPNVEDFGGRYAGYMSEAQELLKRVSARGYVLVPREPTAGMKEAGGQQVPNLNPHFPKDGLDYAESVYDEMIRAYWEKK